MAGRINDDDVKAVRDAVPIDSVVSEYLQLRSAGGGNLKGLCPFHDEKSPSFQVSPSKGLFHCFGCQEGGDSISFLMKLEHLTFAESVERLAAQAGITLRYEQGGYNTHRQQGERTRLLEAHKVAAAFFAERLASPEAEIGRRFLQERGFDEQAAAHFGVGYAPGGWDQLVRYLRGRGFTDRELLTSGIAQDGRRGPIDRFRGRLVWPIRDITGEVVGFGARRLREEDTGPKYLNTPETPIYQKSRVLYGIDLAKRDIAKDNRAVVVEGYTDVMACHLAGITTAIATCGTAFGSEHIKILRRVLMDDSSSHRAGEVVFTFDGDAAGQKAALRAFDEDQRFAARTSIAISPGGMDPCDLRLAHGDTAVAEMIETRSPLFEFALRSVIERHNLDTAEGRSAALEHATPIVARMKDSSIQHEYAVRLAGLVGIPDERFVVQRVAQLARWERERKQRGEAPGAGRRNAPAPAPAPAPVAAGGTALRTGGSYLISGGLGGVGREVSRFLADRYGARLILVGSTPEERLDEDRRRAQAGTRVRYVTVDLAAPDAPARLREAVGADAGRLDGAFHLAGLGTFGQESLDGLGERGAVDGEQLARYTALKVGGLFALAEAAGPAAPLVAFSSVNAYFGGAGYAEYSASNSALNEAVRVLRARGHRAAVSLGWSAWAGLGMSRGAALPIERRGFVPLEPDPALESLLLALGHDRPVTYVGLDGAHPGIAAQVRHKPGWRLVPAYYYAAGTELPADGIAALAPGTESAQVPQLPRRRDGRLDTVRLLQSAGTRATGARPETETERRLAAVWERILGTEDLARDDDFFSLGGHSLMAARLGNDIRAEFGVTLALHEVFGDPTLAAIAAVIDAKSARPADTPDTSAAPGAEPEDGLSAAQRRIFFAESVEPGLALYNIVAAWELTGALDAELLEKALHHVVRRHEALRTVFDTVEGSPVARVVDRPEVPLRRVALDTLDEEEAQARLARTLDAELRHVYDLAAAPLARCTLAALPGDRAVLIVSHHHLASDGWSLGVFMRDLVLVYNALADRDLPELPALPADVPALVRRQDAAGAASEQAAEHWRRQLSRDIAPLELPLDHPRPQMQSYAGDTLFLELGPEEVRRISTAAAGAGVSTAVWLATAYGVLLARLTGRQEFLVGMPAMRRDDPALADAVGMLVNTLPHLMTVPADRPVDAQCAAVRQGMTDLLRYQDYPFDHMVARFGPERDTSRPPLVQTMFNYVPMEGFPQFTGTTRAPLELRHPIARFDFSLHAYERENGLVLAFEYATALFRAETVRGWQQAFRTLIEAMAAGPRTPVGELAVVPAGERERALTLGRNTRAVPEQGSVAAAFAATARAHPDRTALEHGADTLTYRELDDRSAALAAHLAGHGVAAGDRVALDAAKRIDTITGMLAVLRLGASYVPVDPEQPAPVTAAVLRAGGIRGHLTTGGWTGIDADGERTGAVREIPSGPAAAAPPHREISGADEAYVMFTSGTTGRPKGVAIANSSVVGLVRDPDWISFGTGTRVLQTGSLSFDAATLEVWAPLLNGGTLVLTDKENILDVTRLRAEIERSQPTLMWVSAPLFHQLTDADPALFTGVADLLVGGDVVSPEHVNRVLERSPGTRITNGYGPTENTTFTTTHTMTAPVDGPVPIGRPIRGRTALVADESGQVVPFGVQGELYVGGEGLALGYVGNTEETARRFTELPALPGERLYRTGDFATQDADGVIHYRGRRDGQVKVRGHRVELDAVRAALCSLPGVRDAFVLSLPDAGGALAAHVAADGTDAAELRTRVRTLLPPYAVPSAIQVYDALPLKSSGKVDVALLRTGTATAPAEPAAATGTAEPLPPHAERLLAAYAAVLNVPHVGPDDSFFDLGGDSLLTIKLVSVLREEGVPVDPKQVFLYPDVRTLAAALEDHEQQLTARGGRPAAKLVRLRPEPGDGPDLVLAPPAGGTVLGYIELARHLRGFGHVHGVEAPGLGAGESLVLPSFEEAVDFCYEAAQDVLGNSGYVGGHSLGGHIAFHLASALIDKGVKPKGLIILDTPPNLGDIPVADADLTEEETRVFILAMGIGGMLDQDRDRLRQLPYEEAKRVLLERARKDPRVSAFLSAEYLDRFLRLQMHQLMYSREVALPDRALDIPVFVFRTGEHGTDVARLFSDWSRYTTREVTFVDIPGDHASMLRAPHVTEVARLLDQHCGAPR